MRAGLYLAELSRVMLVVPSARVERACLAALVSETSASSNFATRGMSWCLMQASNLHAAWPRFLRPLRLPIPPIRPECGETSRARTDDRPDHNRERYRCAMASIELGRDGRT